MSQAAKIYDITPPISASIGVWPGDTPMSREVLCDMKRGDNITLSTLHATVHLGAHADGPNHYGRDARSVDQQSLDFYLGPCQVIRVPTERGNRVSVSDVETALNANGAEPVNHSYSRDENPRPDPRILAPRVLLATGTLGDPNAWNRDFAAIEPALVDWFRDRGVITIGIDTPSVDSMQSKDLPAHAAFLRNDMAILEGIVLSEVPSGVYELIALPLRLVGFDASPVRAVLRCIE